MLHEVKISNWTSHFDWFGNSSVKKGGNPKQTYIPEYDILHYP